METLTQPSESLKRGLEHCEQLYWHPLYHTQRYASELPSFSSMIHSSLAVAIPQIDVLAFNRVIGLRMGNTPIDQQVEDILRFYETARVSRFFTQISPLLLISDLESRLRKYGFQYYNSWAKLYRKASGAVPKVNTSLEIVAVKSDQALVYGRLLVKAFDWPDELAYALARTVGAAGYRQYFALEDGSPVAAAALFVHGRYASLAIAGTLAEHRGKGAQSALLARRITVAQRLGCQYVISETAEDRADRPVASYRNMRRFGLDVAYLRPNYIYYSS